MRNAMKQAEREMSTLEEKLAALDKELAKPSVYSSRTEAARLSQEQGRLRKQLEAAEAQWMENAEALEAERRDDDASLAS